MRNRYRFVKPPACLHKARLDNLALLPGSGLLHMARYQELANELPDGGVLIVLPAASAQQEVTLRTVAKYFEDRGHAVRVIQ